MYSLKITITNLEVSTCHPGNLLIIKKYPFIFDSPKVSNNLSVIKMI